MAKALLTVENCFTALKRGAKEIFLPRLSSRGMKIDNIQLALAINK